MRLTPRASLLALPVRRQATEMSHNYVRYEELAAAQAAENGVPPRRCCAGLRRSIGWLFGAVCTFVA
jgi:hypothetical protein